MRQYVGFVLMFTSHISLQHHLLRARARGKGDFAPAVAGVHVLCTENSLHFRHRITLASFPGILGDEVPCHDNPKGD